MNALAAAIAQLVPGQVVTAVERTRQGERRARVCVRTVTAPHVAEAPSRHAGREVVGFTFDGYDLGDLRQGGVTVPTADDQTPAFGFVVALEPATRDASVEAVRRAQRRR